LQIDLKSLKRMKFQFLVLSSQFLTNGLCGAGAVLDFFRSCFGKMAIYSFVTNGYTPSPRSIGIIDLAAKRDLIYGLQQLTGKILGTKELALQ
jgi:hypothetical protein